MRSKDKAFEKNSIIGFKVKGFQEWNQKNKELSKSKKTISKLIKQDELNKVLKNNFIFNKANKIDDLPYSKKEHYTELNKNIFKLLIPAEVDADYFEEKIIKDKLRLYGRRDALDILFFSGYKIETIAEIAIENSERNVSALLYFSIETNKNKKFLIKTYFYHRSSINMLVIKQSYKKNDKKIIKFILEDALRINDDYPPWDHIAFNKNIFSNFDAKEMNKFKKIWQQTFKDHKPKNNKKPLAAYWNRTSLDEWTDIMDNYFLRSAKLIRKLDKKSDDYDVYNKIESIRVWIKEGPLYEPEK